MKCYYHHDIDGRLAGYYVHQLCEQAEINHTAADFHECGYDDPKDKHEKNEDFVFIVDLSYTQKTLVELLRICETAQHVIWIDHHQSSVELIESTPALKNREIPNLIYFVDSNASGALLMAMFKEINIYDLIKATKPEITFESAVESNDDIGVYAYKFSIRLVADYQNNHWDTIFPLCLCDDDVAILVDHHDRWVDDNRAHLFNEGTKFYDTRLVYDSPNGVIFNCIWDEFIYDEFAAHDIIEKGTTINTIFHKKNKKELSDTFVVNLDGHDIIVKNDRGNSTVFCEKYDEYDAVVLFYFDPSHNVWKYSMFAHKNSPINCGHIAELMGGGGHAGAAGFTTPASEGPFFMPGYAYRVNNLTVNRFDI